MPETKDKKKLLDIVKSAAENTLQQGTQNAPHFATGEPFIHSGIDPTTGKQVKLDTSYDTSDIDPNYILQGLANRRRAELQGLPEELGAFAKTILPKVGLGILETTGNLLDLENYAGALGLTKTDYDNWFSKSMREGSQYFDETAPIYQKDPSATFNPTDSAWWVKNIGGVVESAAEFGVTGFGLGKLVGSGANALRLAGANKLANAVNTSGQLGTAVGLTHAEGVLTGQQVYQDVLKAQLDKGVPEIQANEIAADAAAKSVQLNYLNVGLNISSLTPFFRSNKIASGLVKEELKRLPQETLEAYSKRVATTFNPSIKKTLGTISHESAQEAGEEWVNIIAQNEGLYQGGAKEMEGTDFFSRALESGLSEEGLVAAGLGAFGGAAQTALTRGITGKKDNAQVKETWNKQRQAIIDNYGIDGISLAKDIKEAGIIQNEYKKALINKDETNTNILKQKLSDLVDYRNFRAETTQDLHERLDEMYSQTSTEQGKEFLMSQGVIENTTQEELAKFRNLVTERKNILKENERIYNNINLQTEGTIESPEVRDTYNYDLFTNRTTYNSLVKEGKDTYNQRLKTAAKLQDELRSQGIERDESALTEKSIYDFKPEFASTYDKYYKPDLDKIQKLESYKELKELEDKSKNIIDAIEDNNNNFDKLTSEDYINSLKKKEVKEGPKPETKPEPPKPTPADTLVPDENPNEAEINSFVHDIIQGNLEQSPANVEFYENNKAEIEKRLKIERAKPVEVTKDIPKKPIESDDTLLFPGLKKDELRKEKGLSTEKEILDVILPMNKKGEDFNQYIKVRKVKSKFDGEDLVLVNLRTPDNQELKLGNVQRPDKTKDQNIKKLYQSLVPEKEYSQADLQKLGVSFTLSKGEFDFLKEENIEGTLLKDITYPMNGEYIVDTVANNTVGSTLPLDIDAVGNIPTNKDGSKLSRYVLIIPETTGNRFVVVYPTKLKALNKIEPLFKEFQDKAQEIKNEPNTEKKKELASVFNKEVRQKYYIASKDKLGTLLSLEVSPDGSIRLITENLVGENWVKEDKPVYVNNINKDNYTFDNLLEDFNKKLKDITLTRDSFKVQLAKDATKIKKKDINESFSTFTSPELVKNRNIKVLFDQEFKQNTKPEVIEQTVISDGSKYSKKNGKWYSPLNVEVSESFGKFLENKVVKEPEYPRAGEKIIQTSATTRIKELQEKYKSAKGVEKARITREINKLKKNLEFEEFDETGDIVYKLGEDNIVYTFKSIDLILKNKQKVENWFKQIKDKGQFWDKVQKDLGIPKEQIDLLKETKGNTLDEVITNFATDYSYTVKINLGTQSESSQVEWSPEENNYQQVDPDNQNIVPSSFYSNLTVPGGINYTENEILTPAIIPSIKGHAQFSTDNGIGWFRSDDKTLPKFKPAKNINEIPDNFVGVNNWKVSRIKEGWLLQHKDVSDQIEKNPNEILEMYNYAAEHGDITKTRRILEVQSDLFQKGRENKDLVNVKQIPDNQGNGEYYDIGEYRYSTGVYGEDTTYQKAKLSELTEDNINENTWKTISEEEFEKNKPTKNNSQNQFLQLLNKDNNWITFFVKSIIQDSARKGYKKVLFPKGETAAKIEGHETLTNEINRINTEIDSLKKTDIYKLAELTNTTYNETNDNIVEKLKNLEQRKSELKSQGIEKLKPIEAFYEIRIKNILDKQYGKSNIKTINDEYGNQWYELEITDKFKEDIAFKQSNRSIENLSKKEVNWLRDNLPDFISIDDIRNLKSNLARLGSTWGAFKDNVIYLNQNAGKGTGYHEGFHAVFRSLLTDKQISLYTKLAKKEINLSKVELRAKINDIKERHPSLDNKQLEDLVYEEYLADKFADWKINKSVSTNSIFKSFFKKIQDFFRWLFNSDESIEALFDKIDRGVFKSAIQQENRFTSINKPVFKALPADPKIEEDPITGKEYKVRRFLPQTRTNEIINTLAAKLKRANDNKENKGKTQEEVLLELVNQRIEKLNSEETFTYIESQPEAQQELLDQKRIDEEYALREGIEIVKEQVFKKINSIKPVEEMDTNHDDQGTQLMICDSWTIGGEESLSVVIREWMEFGTYKKLDEVTGTMEDYAVDTKSAYNGLTRGLAGLEENSILPRLTALAEDNENINGVLELLLQDTRMKVDETGKLTEPTKNHNLIRMLIVSFKKYKANQLFSELKPIFGKTGFLEGFETKVYNANTNDPIEIQISSWAEAFGEIQDKKEFIKDNINNIQRARANTKLSSEEKVNQIKESYKNLGIDLSKGYVKYLVYKDIEEDKLTEKEKNYINTFPDLKPFDFNNVFYGVVLGGNKKGEGLLEKGIDWYSDSGILGRLSDLAENNAIFDETIGNSSFKNADGETVWDIIHGSYVLEEITRINNEAYRSSLKDDNFIKHNLLLSKYDSFLNTLKINITDGLRDTSKDGTSESKEGKVFGDFTEREYLLNVLAYFAEQKKLKNEDFPSTYYVFRQNEAANTAYVAKMPVQTLTKDNKASENAVNQVYESLFKPEYERIGREWKDANKTGSFIPGNIKGFNDEVSEDPNKGRAFKFTEFNYLEEFLGKEKYDALIESAKNEENIADNEKNIKAEIEKYLNESIIQFKKNLASNDIITLDEKDRVKINKLLPSKLVEPYKSHDEALAEVYLNDYIMSSNLNQLMDGDYGKTRKDKVDITKRHKGAMGSGVNYGAGEHTVAYIKDIGVFIVTIPEDSNLVIITEIRDGKYIGSNGKEYTKDQVSKLTTNDAQSYSSQYHKLFSLERLGKLSDKTRAIYKDMIQFTRLGEFGKIIREWNINKDDQKYLEKTNASANPEKTVTFGRDNYIKTSENNLMRGYISYVKDEDVKQFVELTDKLFDLRDTNEEETKDLIKKIAKLYNPIPGKEYWHNLAQQMDLHGIDQVVTESASKGATLTPVDSLQEGFDLSKSMKRIPNAYKREQMETPTGKSVITDSTQLMQLIDTEQDDKTEVEFRGETISVGKLREIYRDLMSRSRGNSFKVALTYIIDSKSGKFDKSKLDKKVERTINESGSDDFLMELFGTQDGRAKYNWNMLPLINKAEAIVLAHFSKGVLSQKVNGTKVSLVSSKGVKIVRDDSGKVVLSKVIARNPEKYKDYQTSELKYNVKDPETGEIYSECILSERALTKAGLKIGDSIPKELSNLLGVRIPTDDKHSMIALRVVDVLPNYMEGTGLFPDEIVHLSGADFDIDSLYIQTPSYYLGYKNKPIKHGSENTPEERFMGFKEYLLTDKEFRAVFSDLLENDSRYKVMKLEDRSELEKLDFESNEEHYEAIELHKKEIEDIKDKIVTETMEYFKYPLTAKDYQEYIDKYGELNKLVIDNQILEARLGLLTNSHIQKEIAHEKTSTDPFSEEADYIEGIKPAQEGLNVKYRSTSDLVGKFMAFLKNAAGKKGIGPVANSLQLFTMLSKAKAKLNANAYKLTITSTDGSRYETQRFRNLNTAGERVVGLLGSLLNTMTDNAKDPIAGRMNLKLNLLNTYSMLLMQGLSKRNSTLILNAPIIQEYSKKKETATFGVKTAFEASEKSWAIKESLFEKYLGKKLTNEELDSEFKDTEFDATKIEELIKGTLSKEESDRLNAELFYAWLKIEEQANVLSNVNFLLKSNKGLPSSFNELENDFSEAIGELGLSEFIGYPTKFENKSPIDMVEILKGDKHTLTNIKIIKKVLEEAPNLFISQSKGFKEEFNKLLVNLKPSSVLKSDVKKSIEREFLGFLSTRAYKNKIKELIEGKDTSDKMKARFENKLAMMNDSLVFPELDKTKKTLAKQLSEFKMSANESIRSNTAIRHLNYEFKFTKTPEGVLVENPENKKKRDVVFTRTWSKPSPKLTNDIIDGFKQLYLVPETHDFAVNMFNYLMVTDNMSFKSGSFVKFLAPFMFKELSGGLDVLTEELAKDKPDYKKVLGEDIKPLAMEFREIFNRYKPNWSFVNYRADNTKRTVLGFGLAKEIEGKEGKVYKAVTVFSNYGTVQFNVFNGTEENNKDNAAYLDNLFERRPEEGKPYQWKFPEYYNFGKKYYKLVEELDNKGERIDFSATYKETFPFGYRGLSPYYQSLKDNLKTHFALNPSTKSNKEVVLGNIEFEEEQSSGYRERTIKNASADATIALAVDFNTAGEKLTKSSVLTQKKKYIPIDANKLEITKERVDKIIESLNSVNAKTLNIAGNGIYTMKGKYTQEEIDNFTYTLLKEVLESPNLKNKIESIRTGGQTGFDEAGAKAGLKIGIPTKILAPKGWIFRNIEGKDISNEEQFKSRFEDKTKGLGKGDEVVGSKEELERITITEEQLDNINANMKKAGIKSKYTIKKFNELTKEEQQKVIECYG